MGIILIGGLGLLVVYLAMKSPDVNVNANRESLPPNDNLPALGSVGNPSPAMSGGSPMASQLFRTAAAVNAPIVGSSAVKVSASPSVSVFNTTPGTLVAPTATVAEMSKTMMGLVKQPTVVTTPSPNPLFKAIKL